MPVGRVQRTFVRVRPCTCILLLLLLLLSHVAGVPTARAIDASVIPQRLTRSHSRLADPEHASRGEPRGGSRPYRVRLL